MGKDDALITTKKSKISDIGLGAGMQAEYVMQERKYIFELAI